MNSSTTRMLASFFLAMAAVMAGAQTPAQPQVAPEQPVAPQQAAPQQPQTAPQQNAVPQPSTAQPQTSAQQNVSSEGQALHILVGKSVVVNVQAPITRVLSSNPSVIETLATSPTEIVVEGRAAGSSSLILWDQSGRSQMLDVIVDVDVSGLRSAIERSYPDQHIDVQADGGRLILTGKVTDPKMIEDLTKMSTVYSNQVVNSLTLGIFHDRQVLLEVKFAEVDRTKFAQFGVNLLSTGAGNTLGSTTTGQFGGIGAQHITDIAGPGTHGGPFTTDQTINNVLNIFLFRFDIHFGAVIQDLEQKSVLQILAEPNLMALNGQKATFLAGGEFPFPLVQPGNGFTAVTIQFKPFGVKLDFTGNISNDGTIRLHVAPEVSTLDFTNALAIQGFTVPAISTRRAETDIELKDGQSFGIAGLLDNRAQAQLNKIPGIGDIPVLGQLFRSRNINKSKTELMVLVTPHIVDPVHTATPPPANPNLSVPFLDKPKFDEHMPGHEKTESSPSPTPSAK
ncbi:MAG TPA: type II and III secretion system protein family protein [Terriglobales bacterium]|nr:type II and III secretion system protein family protein [Terriglobales bacterium]